MNLKTELFRIQQLRWPTSGKHILAQYDSDAIYVYQAYRSTIAEYAVEHQRFGGDFSYTRMSWIKPNFLWMMYRSGWATKEGQENILAVKLKRSFFEEILCQAVPSTFNPARYSTKETWKSALESSEVRLQWDPDHDPTGKPLERRAIQLGLRGSMLRRYGETEVISIEDISHFVRDQGKKLESSFGDLMTPIELVYVPTDPMAGRVVSLSTNYEK